MARTCLFITLFMTIATCVSAELPGWDIEVISYENIDWWNALEISGSNVAWIGLNGNFYESIFFYDGSTGEIFQVTNDNDNKDMLGISGSNMVWLCKNEVFYYNHQTRITTRLTSNDYDDSSVRISGTTAVWTGFDGNDLEVFVYDGNDVTQLTDNDYDDYKPDISGTNITWYGDPNSDDFEIFFYDGLETIQLTDNEHNDERPRISGSNIAWQGYDGNDNEIFLYHHETETTTQLTFNESGDYSPQISDSNVFWGNSFYDGESVTEIPFVYSMSQARLSGAKVVWYSGAALEDLEIYVYDHYTQDITKLTDNTFMDRWPRISGNNVAWFGEFVDPYGHSDWNIMMAKYTGCVEPPDADTNNDCKIDATDLGNIATNWLTELNLPGFESTRLTDNFWPDYNPKISEDNIVWLDYGDNTIRLYDSSNQTSIELGFGSFHVISGSNVAWIDSDGSDDEIYYYDGETVKKLTDNDYKDGDTNTYYTGTPISICGSRIAWSAKVNNMDWEIFLYDGDTIHQITDNEYDDNWPQVSESLIAWECFDGNDDEICFYDGHTIRQLTNNDYFDYNPQISGSIIVWYNWYGYGLEDSEIFLYNHDANSMMPTPLHS